MMNSMVFSARSGLHPGWRVLAGLLLTASIVCAENWPGFRGPTHQGVSSETGLPLHWNTTENVAWKTPIPGEAWSSPIVWEDRVFLTTATEDGASCRVLALDRTSGNILWDKEVFRQLPEHKNPRNSYATPTPCTDGQRVYAVFGDGSFAALDFSGNVVWTNRDFPFYGEHGLGSSPLVWKDLLIMARDGSNPTDPKKLGWQVPWDKSYLVALDTQTGQLRWKANRGMSRISHVCPNIWLRPDGRAHIISGAGDVVQGFDAATGERLWTSKNIGEGVVPSIVLGEDVAFTASGWGGRESIKAFRLGGAGDLGESNLVWEQRKGMPRVPSFLYLKVKMDRPGSQRSDQPYPVRLYTIHDGGVAMCLDATDGQIIWQERVGGSFSASPVSAEGRIYLLSDEGETAVIEAGPEFKILARNPLGEKVQASMAVSHGSLFIRTASHLFCVQARDGRSR